MRNRTEHHRHGRDRPGGANRARDPAEGVGRRRQTSSAHGSTRCEPECGPDTALQLLVEATAAEARDADLVVIVTAHDAFDYEALQASGTAILDTRHRLNGPTVEHL